MKQPMGSRMCSGCRLCGHCVAVVGHGIAKHWIAKHSIANHGIANGGPLTKLRLLLLCLMGVFYCLQMVAILLDLVPVAVP